MRPSRLIALAAMLGAWSAPVGGADPVAGETWSARLASPATSLPLYGDLWVMTWADDDRLYSIFGDGTGMGHCVPSTDLETPGEGDEYPHHMAGGGLYQIHPPEEDESPQGLFCGVFDCARPYPLCPFTTAGVVSLAGFPPHFAECPGADQCVISRQVPYGDDRSYEWWDKPSSMIFIDGRMYAAMHYPPGVPDYGYMAYSDDYGRTWKPLHRTPWGPESRAKVVMFIQMGQAYAANRDGYLYGLAIENEVDLRNPSQQPMFLVRVPVGRHGRRDAASDPLLQYRAYEYFAGLDTHERPRWAKDEWQAVPLDGLTTVAQGSAMYHDGIGRYLFLSGLVDLTEEAELGIGGVDESHTRGGLFAAPAPWGPWRRVASFPAAYIASLIPKGAGPRHVYFTAAGGSVPYNLNIGRLEVETE